MLETEIQIWPATVIEGTSCTIFIMKEKQMVSLLKILKIDKVITV